MDAKNQIFLDFEEIRLIWFKEGVMQTLKLSALSGGVSWERDNFVVLTEEAGEVAETKRHPGEGTCIFESSALQGVSRECDEAE